MDYKYLYDFNKERYQALFERELTCREDLQSVVVEQGYLLPNRYAPNRLFGHGGVLNAKKEYEKCSEMNAYSKYATTPTTEDEMEIYLGEGYEIEEKDVPYLDEDVVYLGYINNHWGHFLLDATTRLYTFLEEGEKKHKYVFLVNEGQDYTPIASIARFLELLGIREQILFISQVTKCRSIIIPEQGYMVNGYYSKGFLKIFEAVADKVDCSKYPAYQKVYYSRANFKKAKGSEIGEQILLKLFQKNDFTIVAPEKCTLDEQIAIVRNSELLAAITGTIPHNLLFAKPGQKLLIINKTHNLNVAQMDINVMKDVAVTYVDAYLAKFPVMIGVGPFLLDYSQQLETYAKEQGLMPLSAGEYTEEERSRNSKAYEKMYRLKMIKENALAYQKNAGRFDYFHPAHLVQYNEAFYYKNHPIRISEKACVFMQRVERFIKRFLK